MHASGPVVAAFGAVAVDEVLVVDQPLGDGKGRVVSRSLEHGGNAATALAAVASLGGRARFLGTLPDRATWPAVWDDLRGAGVDVSAAFEAVGLPPIRSTVLVTADGGRFIAFDDDDTAAGPATDFDPDRLDGVGAVLLDSYGPDAGLRVVQEAKQRAIPSIGDLELLAAPAVRELARSVDHLVLPLHAAVRLTGEPLAHRATESLRQQGDQTVVVTDGAHGVWFARPGQPVRHLPAFPVPVVDTTGCGDVFHGAYSLAVASGLPVDQAVARAAAAAAVCATGNGGRGRLPTEARVLDLLAAGHRTAPRRTTPAPPPQHSKERMR